MDTQTLTSSLHIEAANVVQDAYKRWMEEEDVHYNNGGDGRRVLLTVYFAYARPYVQLLPNVQTLKNDIRRELELRPGMKTVFSAPRLTWRTTEEAKV